jgi:hypothetical protein
MACSGLARSLAGRCARAYLRKALTLGLNISLCLSLINDDGRLQVLAAVEAVGAGASWPFLPELEKKAAAGKRKVSLCWGGGQRQRVRGGRRTVPKKIECSHGKNTRVLAC